MSDSLTIGILALQGAFAEHFQTIQSLSTKSLTKTLPRLNPMLVRTKEDLDACDALIIPGGESTTMAIVAKNMGLLDPLRDFVKIQRKPTWGTCAGAILLSEGGVEGSKKGGQDVIGGVDIRIGRNGFGSQVESFEAPLQMEPSSLKRSGEEEFVGVFIRAPIVLSLNVNSSQPPIEVLARIPAGVLPLQDPATSQDEENDPRRVVALRQGNLLLTTFHPELTRDPRFHEYFLSEIIAPLTPEPSTPTGGPNENRTLPVVA